VIIRKNLGIEAEGRTVCLLQGDADRNRGPTPLNFCPKCAIDEGGRTEGMIEDGNDPRCG